MKRATDEQLLWKAMSEKDIEMAKRKKAASRSDDEDSGSDDKPKEGGRLDTNPFNIPRVPGKDDPNTPGADEAPKDPEDENAPPGDDEDPEGDPEGDDEEDTEEGEEDMPDFGLTPDDAEEGDEEGDEEDGLGDLEEGEEGDDEDLGLDEEDDLDLGDEEGDDAGIQAGGSEVQQLVGELAAAEKDFYANRGMHGRDHHKTEAAMDAFHRIVRKLVRAVHSGEAQGPAGNEIALETQDDDSEMEFPEDSEGSEDSEGEDIDGFEDAEEGDDAEGADPEGETQDTEEVDEGEEDQETKPGKKKSKVPPQFAKALTQSLLKRFAPTLYKASGPRARMHLITETDGLLRKAGGPFIGPRGGKWADAKHTIPYSEGKPEAKVDRAEGEKPTKPKLTVSADKLKSPKSEHTSRTRTPEGTYEYRYPHPDHGGDHEISFSVEKAPTKTRPDGYTVRVGTGHTLLHGGVSNGKVTDLDAWSAPGVKAASPAVQAVAKRALLDAHKMFTAEKAVGSSGKKPKAKKEAGSKEAYDTVQRHMGQSFTERYGDPMTHVSPDHWVGAIHHALDTGKPGDAQKMAMALLHEVKFSTRAGSYSQEQRKRFADTVHAAQTHKGSPTDGRVSKKQLHRMFGVQDTKKSAGLVLDHSQLFKGGPYIGPRGGKWADAAHTIPWTAATQAAATGGASEKAKWEKVPSLADATSAVDKLCESFRSGTVSGKTPHTGDLKAALDTLEASAEKHALKGAEKKTVLKRLREYLGEARVHTRNMSNYASTGRVSRNDYLAAARSRDALAGAVERLTFHKPGESVEDTAKRESAKAAREKKNNEKASAARVAKELADFNGDDGGHGALKGIYKRRYLERLAEHKERYGAYPAGHHPDKVADAAPEETEAQRKARLEAAGQTTLALSSTHKLDPIDSLGAMYVMAEGTLMEKSVGKNPNGYDKGTPDTGEEKDIGYGKMTGPAQGDFIDWGTMGYGKMAEFDPTMTGKAGNSLVTEATGKTASGDPVASGRGTGAGAAGAASAGSASSAAAQASAGTAASSGGGGGGFTPTRGLGGKMCDPKKLKAAKQDVMTKLMGKMKADGEGPTFKLPNGTKKSFTDASGRTLKKGLYAFSERNAKVPTRLLYPYLCSFIEEAFEHESREKSHANVPAADLYKYWATAVMNELVQYAAINPALRAACEKYNVNEKTVGSILRMKKLIQPKSDATPNSDGNGGLQVSGVTGEAYDPNAAILALSQKNDWIQWDKRAPKDIHPTREPVRKSAQFVDDTVSPYAALAKAQDAKHQARWSGAEGNVQVGNHASCAIHGRDVYKSGHVANPWLRCTCNP